MTIELRPPRSVRLRAARPADVPACAAIIEAWIAATPWMPALYPEGDTAAWFRRVLYPVCRMRVAETAGRIAGFVAVDQHDMVQALYVAEEARGQGIGSALVERAKLLAPGGLRLWVFAPDAAARRFYARHGFAEIGGTGGDNEAGVPDILLGWQP